MKTAIGILQITAFLRVRSWDPYFFLLYVNDLKQIKWNTYMTLYADDIIILAIHYNHKNMIKSLQHDFDVINKWFETNELYISKEKTCYLNILTSHMKEEVSEIFMNKMDCKLCENFCSCEKLSSVVEYNYLGLIIDQNWKFSKYIDKLILRIRKIIPMLYKVKDFLNNNAKKNLFECWVNSIIRYGCGIYGYTTSGYVEKLQKLQNKAMKVLFRKKIKHNTEMLYKENKIMTVKQLIKNCVIQRNYFKNEFKEKITRSRRDMTCWLKVPAWRNSYGKRGKCYIVPTEFNTIPVNLRNIRNPTEMKRKIKNWILTS